jgi:hypothetical protein
MVEGVLTDYRRIPNPYVLEQNADILLEKGFGVAVGPGEKANLTVTKMDYRRFFNLILVRLVSATENDSDTRDTIETALLEDLQTVRHEIETDGQTLGGTVVRTDYESDSGLQFLLGNNVKFYALSITLSVVYEETL